MKITKGALKADALLLTTAIIWGFAFSAQRSGMDFVGPLAYNGLRYALGALVLLPLLFLRRKSAAAAPGAASPPARPAPAPRLSGARKAIAILLAGTVLFAGSLFQQLGLMTTTAGNAGFITSLYVVLVPLLGLLAGRRASARVWLGAFLALGGLYLISIRSGYRMERGDALELAGAFFWAVHILVISRLAPRMDSFVLAAGQFAVCSALSLAVSALAETTSLAAVRSAALPILYGGLLSSGVAFTLQIVAQRKAHPASASIILSMESLFAGLGGILLLREPFGLRFGSGAALMLAGLVLSQLPGRKS